MPRLPWVGRLLAEPNRRETYYLRHSDHRMKWSGQEQDSGSLRKIFFLALRIGAETLLSQRGKRLERKPDPKGNAVTKIESLTTDFLLILFFGKLERG